MGRLTAGVRRCERALVVELAPLADADLRALLDGHTDSVSGSGRARRHRGPGGGQPVLRRGAARGQRLGGSAATWCAGPVAAPLHPARPVAPATCCGCSRRREMGRVPVVAVARRTTRWRPARVPAGGRGPGRARRRRAQLQVPPPVARRGRVRHRSARRAGAAPRPARRAARARRHRRTGGASRPLGCRRSPRRRARRIGRGRLAAPRRCSPSPRHAPTWSGRSGCGISCRMQPTSYPSTVVGSAHGPPRSPATPAPAHERSSSPSGRSSRSPASHSGSRTCTAVSAATSTRAAAPTPRWRRASRWWRSSRHTRRRPSGPRPSPSSARASRSAGSSSAHGPRASRHWRWRVQSAPRASRSVPSTCSAETSPTSAAPRRGSVPAPGARPGRSDGRALQTCSSPMSRSPTR